MCKWCVERDGELVCRSGNEATCDFKDLLYEKEAIIERVDQEFERVEDMLKDIKNIASKEKRQDMIALVADKVLGIKVMIQALKDEFHYKYKSERNPFAFTKLVMQTNKYLKKNR